MRRTTYTLWSLITICIVSTNYILAQNSYYFDSQNGKDSHDGLSKNAAWSSHSKVETLDLQPGDTVYFKRGSGWKGCDR